MKRKISNLMLRAIKSPKLTVVFLLWLLYILLKRSSNSEDEDQIQVIQDPVLFKELLENEATPRNSEIVERRILEKEQEDLDSVTHKDKWFKGSKFSLECPDYVEYSQSPHAPFSEGPLKLPFMRPSKKCRTFKSKAVEQVITDMKERMADPDLFRLFENAFPNTLDTTVLWFEPSTDEKLPRTFISTGDIHAEWLRDSARQLSVYQPLIQHDILLQEMIKGAIVQQAEYIAKAPYCNAFQPPESSGVSRKPSSIDAVYPTPPWKYVFECKWELDSLASFLTLSNDYYYNSKDLSVFETEEWLMAFEMLLLVLNRESKTTFDENGLVQLPQYTFQRETNVGTETLPLAGAGNPVNIGTGLIRSAFRPSDDACIYQFFIPANAQLYAELNRVIPILKAVGQNGLAGTANTFAKQVKAGIEEHAIVDHKEFGKVFAYEIDGYGGINFMDDANIPSLLALPDMGFVDLDDPVYQNTRKMVLSTRGNPYFLKGRYFRGIGGPHVGIYNAWPMSLLVSIRTSEDDQEIMENLELVKTTTAGLGLVHESINVHSAKHTFTRPWFSWSNSEFGKTILDLAKRKPYLIFKEEYADLAYEFSGDASSSGSSI